MSNLREVNDDILKDWLLLEGFQVRAMHYLVKPYTEDELSSLTCDEDRKHWVYFDEISERILKNIPKQNRAYIQKQLNLLDDNFMDYIGYWNEKYYRNGFCDGVEIIIKCL